MQTRRFPIWRIVAAFGMVYLVETLIMFVLEGLPGLPPLVDILVDSTALVLLLILPFYVLLFQPLLTVIGELERTEVSLAAAKSDLEKKVEERTGELGVVNAQLAHTVGEIEARMRESDLLTEMTQVLQTCLTSEEAYHVIGEYGQHLFPAHSGALSILRASRNFLEVVVTWGDSSACANVFGPEECWALRRGRPHHVGRDKSGMFCTHAPKAVSADYVCVPLMAQGESLGVLHLCAANTQVPGVPAAMPPANTVRAAEILADHVSLAVGNLRLRETLRNQSIRDPLTGLFNRRYMEESLDRELCRCVRNELSVAVVMLDIDHFKNFNDTFGHGAGDALLREVGKLLGKVTRGCDIACRYGGEEFTLVFPEASFDDAVTRCEEIREAVAQIAVEYHNTPLSAVTLSLGIAAYPEIAKDPETLLRAADAALYRAKRDGRNRVVRATAQLLEELSQTH